MADTSKLNMFRNRLVKVYRHLSRQAKRQGISCYRLYDHDLPEFPFCIEVYEGKLYVAEYKRRHGMTEEEHDRWIEQSIVIISEVTAIGQDAIYLTLRQRKPGKQGQYQKTGAENNEFIVQESGLQFIVNLGDYIDTGLFPDHRITRQMVREQSAGKRVLNLFAYTGSFSVYAAAGGAEQVITVDLSNTYLNWAKRNMKLNGFVDEKKYLFIQVDVLKYLETIPPGYFDIIIMDPPTFSNSKRMDGILDIQKDHVMLINRCLHGLRKEGRLYFSTNYRKFELEKDKLRATEIVDIKKATTPFDFEGKLHRDCFLIFV